MKVVLVSLPYSFALEQSMNPPLGLCYIASFLKSQGVCDVSGVDLANHGVSLEMLPLDADVYGVGCMTSQYGHLVRTCDFLRARNQTAKIAVGGPHFTNCPEDKPPSADVVIRGDGEHEFYKFVAGHRVDELSIHRCDVQSMPFPDRDIFGLENYRRTLEGEPAVHLVTLRGCPYDCSFCDRVSVGRNVRYRDVCEVLDEVDFVIDRYGIRRFVVYDDIFTLRKQRAIEFSRAFKDRGVRWRCWSRADTLDEKTLVAMKDAGLVSITLGIESGDDGVLERIGKGVSAKMNREALLLCRRCGVAVRCSLMYGNPGECRESIQNTVDLVVETQPDEWNLAVLTPVPGSMIWRDPARFGFGLDKSWVRENEYAVVNRFRESGVGDLWYAHDVMSDVEFCSNLEFMVSELERLCPRKCIQDTIQQIDLRKLKRLGLGVREDVRGGNNEL